MSDSFSDVFTTIYDTMLKFFAAIADIWNSLNETTVVEWLADNLNALESVPILNWIGDLFANLVVELAEHFGVGDITCLDFLLFGWLSIMVAVFIVRLVA